VFRTGGLWEVTLVCGRTGTGKDVPRIGGGPSTTYHRTQLVWGPQPDAGRMRSGQVVNHRCAYMHLDSL